MQDLEKIDTRFFAAEREADLDVVGETVPRVDARAHVTGKTQFYEDMTLPGMLHLKMARSTRHHALIKKIDLKAAEKVPGFARALTHKDVPNNWYTILRLIGVEPNDEPVLPEDRVLFQGEQIAAILADTAAAAGEAVSKVKIDYKTNYVNKADADTAIGSFGRGLRFIKPTPDNPNKPRQIWSQGETEFNRFSRELAEKQFREEGLPIVCVRIKGLKPPQGSRLIDPQITPTPIPA